MRVINNLCRETQDEASCLKITAQCISSFIPGSGLSLLLTVSTVHLAKFATEWKEN